MSLSVTPEQLQELRRGDIEYHRSRDLDIDGLLNAYQAWGNVHGRHRHAHLDLVLVADFCVLTSTLDLPASLRCRCEAVGSARCCEVADAEDLLCTYCRVLCP